MYSRCQGNELWMMLLEKAFAKLHGSCNSLDGGTALEAMIDLTGAPTHSYYFKVYCGDVQKLKELWMTLKQSDEEGCLMTITTTPTCTNGLVAHHAYTLLEVKEVPHNGDTLKLVKIR